MPPYRYCQSLLLLFGFAFHVLSTLRSSSSGVFALESSITSSALCISPHIPSFVNC